MLERYRDRIATMPDEVIELVSIYFKLPSDGLSLFDALADRGLGQADLALALLRAEVPAARASLEELLGRPVEVLAPRPPKPLPPAPRKIEPDDRRVLRVAPNPRLPTTPAFQRYQSFKPGRTIRQLLARGVTREDLREAAAKGWVELSPVGER